MSDFAPVTSLADLDTLDDAEIVAGYLDGAAGEPEPGNNRSRSYWHGWRNGMIDAGRLPKDEAAASLAREFVTAGRNLARQ